MELFLKDRRALVTGATAGIGRAIALSLAGEGVRLALVGRRPGLLEEVANQCRAAGSDEVILIEQDMMAEAAAQHTTTRAFDGLGGVDILLNCMGASRQITLSDGDEVWEESMTLNWKRHRQLTHRILPSMVSRGWGRIINITGPNEMNGLNSAGVAKVAVHAWAKGVAELVAKQGVTVNCIGPGKINSEQIARIYSPERRQATADAFIPIGRFGEPQELADLATFLASPRASYITGTVIPVDGGFRRYLF
jgi:3-oxoacyl-[acyl-carrier protein] reductase